MYKGEDGFYRYIHNKKIYLMPTIIRDNYEPRGWDWNELAYMLGFGELDEGEDGYGFDFGDLEEDFLFELVLDRFLLDDLEEIAQVIRKFLSKFITQNNGFWDPLWEGLSKIEDDFTLTQATYALLGHMWN